MTHAERLRELAYDASIWNDKQDADACRAGADALDRLAQAELEIRVSDELLADRNRILDALPCPQHGPCVPYVLEQIGKLAQTCGNCAYGGVSPTGPFAFCDADGSGDFTTRRHPFAQRLMPLDERCKGWTKREDA